MSNIRYGLVTAVYNGEKTIAATIESVARQPLRPEVWVVADNGSTDSTWDVLLAFAENQRWIRPIKVERAIQDANFSEKVRAVNRALQELPLTEFDYIGITDADVEFPENYFSILFSRMIRDARLGIAGGEVWEYFDEKLHRRRRGRGVSVAGAVQMFASKCLLDIGGEFIELPYGGEDAAMEFKARARGWRTETICDLVVKHAGRVGQAAGRRVTAKYLMGKRCASLGYWDLFFVFRCMSRLLEAPPVVGTVAELLGYFCERTSNHSSPLDEKTLSYVRREQIARVRAYLRQSLMGTGARDDVAK